MYKFEQYNIRNSYIRCPSSVVLDALYLYYQLFPPPRHLNHLKTFTLVAIFFMYRSFGPVYLWKKRSNRIKDKYKIFVYSLLFLLKGKSMKNHVGSCDLLQIHIYRRKIRKKVRPWISKFNLNCWPLEHFFRPLTSVIGWRMGALQPKDLLFQS